MHSCKKKTTAFSSRNAKKVRAELYNGNTWLLGAGSPQGHPELWKCRLNTNVKPLGAMSTLSALLPFMVFLPFITPVPVSFICLLILFQKPLHLLLNLIGICSVEGSGQVPTAPTTNAATRSSQVKTSAPSQFPYP